MSVCGIQQEGERMLDEARARQAEILNQAKATGDSIIREARERAQEEGQKLLLDARQQIAAEKENALRDIRQTVADLSVVIAEKVVRENRLKMLNSRSLLSVCSMKSARPERNF